MMWSGKGLGMDWVDWWARQVELVGLLRCL